MPFFYFYISTNVIITDLSHNNGNMIKSYVGFAHYNNRAVLYYYLTSCWSSKLKKQIINVSNQIVKKGS